MGTWRTGLGRSRLGEGERAVLPALHASFLLNPVVRPPIGAEASSWAKPSVRIWRRRSARSSHNDRAGGGRRPGAVAGKQSSSERTDVGERTHDNAAGAPEFAGCRAHAQACTRAPLHTHCRPKLPPPRRTTRAPELGECTAASLAPAFRPAPPRSRGSTRERFAPIPMKAQAGGARPRVATRSTPARAARSDLGECTSGEPGAGRPVGAAARTRKQRRPRSRRTLAELSKCRGPANARDACREASDEQAPEQGTPCRFGERSSEPAARSALTSRGSAPTTTSGGEYYPPLGGVAIARESAEGPVRAGANLSASHRESVRWGTFSALASGRP